MKPRIWALIFFMATSWSLSAQVANEYYVTLNGNLFLPGSNSQKGIYPIAGYDKATDPKLLIGGLGIGLSAFKQTKEKTALKAQINFSRNVYWDEPTILNSGPDPSQVMGNYVGAGSNYCLGLSGLGHYYLKPKFSIGAGLGTRILLLSVSRLPDGVNYSKKGKTSANKFYKPVQPFIPLEASLKFKKVLINIRYEWSILNSLKHDLAQYKKDRYGLLFFEVGYRIK